MRSRFDLAGFARWLRAGSVSCGPPLAGVCRAKRALIPASDPIEIMDALLMKFLLVEAAMQ
jgi:hypothetical protein